MGHGDIKCVGKSSLISRNVTINGRRTSVRLEPDMWTALHEISEREGCTIHDLCTLIYIRKGRLTSLTAAIRVFLMLYFRAAATEEGHRRVGHGDFTHMCQRAGIGKMTGDERIKRWLSARIANQQRRASEQRILQVRYS